MTLILCCPPLVRLFVQLCGEKRFQPLMLCQVKHIEDTEETSYFFIFYLEFKSQNLD